jgi:hypothetical protein
MTQSLSCRISSRTSAAGSAVADAVDRGVHPLRSGSLKVSSARPYSSAARPCTFELAYACGTASIASWTAASVGSRSTRRFHGTSARSNAPRTPRPSPRAAAPGSRTAPRGARDRASARRPKSPDLEQQRAEHQVRLVADRLRGGVGPRPGPPCPAARSPRPGGRPAAVRCRGCRRRTRRSSRPRSAEHLGGIARPAGRQVDVRAQELDVVLDRLGTSPWIRSSACSASSSWSFWKWMRASRKAASLRTGSSTLPSSTALIARPARWCMR